MSAALPMQPQPSDMCTFLFPVLSLVRASLKVSPQCTLWTCHAVNLTLYEPMPRKCVIYNLPLNDP